MPRNVDASKEYESIFSESCLASSKMTKTDGVLLVHAKLYT